jgi:RNA polymerase sigma factor (sigma-70 family)
MADEPDDGELLAAADQDPGAFRALYDRWAGRLLTYCHRRTGDAEAALELVAETFAIAYEKRASFRGDGPVGGWLHGIAGNLVAAYHRRQRTELRACKRLAVVVPRLDDAAVDQIERLVEADTWRAALREALATLSVAERDAVQLRVVQQLDYPTVAARLCCSQQAARACVHRGLARLAAIVEVPA